jgi:uncharacterized protein (TIGR03086 family)
MRALLPLLDGALADAGGMVERCASGRRLDLPTPCEGWDASALIGHLIGQNRGFAVAVGAGDAPLEAFAPVALTPAAVGEQWRDSVRGLTAAFEAADAGRTIRLAEFDLTVPVETALRMQILDTAVHAWDLATALGVPYRPSADIVALVLGFARSIAALPPGVKTGFAAPLETVGEPWCDALRLLGRRAGDAAPA